MVVGDVLSILLLVAICSTLMFGFPVAFTLAGVSVIFALLGASFDAFNLKWFAALPSRYFGVMTNEVLVAVPLFVFMGVMLERSRIAEDLLQTMGECFGQIRGGLALSVTFVGMLLAASTGIVGATVVTMGLLSLPTMIRAGYSKKLACGTICAAGTLGQIIPPSIALVILGDVLIGIYTEAELAKGKFAVAPLSVLDLFAGGLIPGLVLVGLYMVYQIGIGILKPDSCPPVADKDAQRKNLLGRAVRVMLPPAFLILAVLGSILGGLATPTEAASFGALGATILAIVNRVLTFAILKDVMRTTTRISAMVFGILIGASVFSLVFRGLGGDTLVESFFAHLPGGFFGALLFVMVLMFLLGFIIDFIEIVFIVVPIVAPILLKADISPIWLGILMGVNLQTSFLTPPFGWALFYLRGVAPPEVNTSDIYYGIIPFVFLQCIGVAMVWYFPELATWLPSVIFAGK
jgi:tripartite ATP-independent transporter DctM subunit